MRTDQESSSPPARRSSREEEQFLCNEALRTGDFDSISDSEWVTLCERVADKGRLAAENDDLPRGL
ncbi:MAG: hypothetical protein QGD90_07165 [Candidatus Hydrogenedentes bacterium]|nr:hypothetical protein [Candidatus Hydrogenedentota bacterium]